MFEEEDQDFIENFEMEKLVDSPIGKAYDEFMGEERKKQVAKARKVEEPKFKIEVEETAPVEVHKPLHTDSVPIINGGCVTEEKKVEI